MRLALLLSSLLVFAFNAVSNAQSPDGYFPLTKGNYWIYKGVVKWVQKNNETARNQIAGRELTWKMEVVDTAACPNVFAALVKGFPSDLSWYEPGKEPGDHLILRVGTAHYHQFDGEKALELWNQIKASPNFTLSNIVNEDSLLLDVPLIDGKIYGSFANTTRARYCWVVEGCTKFDMGKVKGAPKIVDAKVFTLTFRTNPDHTIMGFVPGLGVVSYQYGHHGTTSECELGLVECKLAPAAEQ